MRADSNTLIMLLTAAALLISGAVWFGRLDDQVATTLRHVDQLDAEMRIMEHTLDKLTKDDRDLPHHGQ